MKPFPAPPVFLTARPAAAACVAAIALVMMQAPPGRAADESDYMLATAGDLADLCASPEDPSAIHMCQGFIVAVDQVHIQLAAAMDEKLYCLPTESVVTRNGAAAAFAAWVAENPRIATVSPIDGLVSWALDAFPCPAGQ
ncbi:Rap1a/Tai family immunity protein [Oceanicella sp. SM1341]|uniref:Rap1a/Tai family immunity protein n=1 Tax=Oceanicella sp. SM1341 TaxID=1548889 RepID=UPI0013004C3F|nr:Rap1a/Tai family immunity protein [Oceanicella sp. SM1341]